jgi:catechol 2,3-dioxygenase-like lactoylglutathione lyase family enzyme
MDMTIRIAVVSLWAEDVPAAAHFYRDVVGLSLLPHHDGDRPHFDVADCILTIVHRRPALPPDPEPRFPVVAFSIPELEPAIEKLHLHEVDLPWGVETNAAGRWVMFRDPAENLVKLVEINT